MGVVGGVFTPPHLTVGCQVRLLYSRLGCSVCTCVCVCILDKEKSNAAAEREAIVIIVALNIILFFI